MSSKIYLSSSGVVKVGKSFILTKDLPKDIIDFKESEKGIKTRDVILFKDGRIDFIERSCDNKKTNDITITDENQIISEERWNYILKQYDYDIKECLKIFGIDFDNLDKDCEFVKEYKRNEENK